MEDEESVNVSVAQENEVSNNLPLARIKKIMKSDDDVGLLSQEAVFLVAKATELFAGYMGSEAYKATSRDKRRTVQYRDVSKLVSDRDEFEFLQDIIPSQVPFRKYLEIRSEQTEPTGMDVS
eukprot:Nk52_evm2s2020 gene=Nk52_evmTU2s2020